MKKAIFIISLIQCITCLLAQSQSRQDEKPLIDSSVFGKWPSVNGAIISNDGHYTFYTINNQPVGKNTLVLQAIRRNWRIEIPQATPAWPVTFTSDSHLAFVSKSNDSLGIIRLDESAISYIPNVMSFKIPLNGKQEWIAYQLSPPGKELVLRNLITEREKHFVGVKNYLFSSDGTILLLQLESKKDSVITQLVNWVNLSDGTITTIWQGAGAKNFIFDINNTQLAFTVEHKIDNESINSLWYYKRGTDRAIQIADDRSPGIEANLKLDEICRFSNDGGSIFFTLKESNNIKPKPSAVQVDVWSYMDVKLQSKQLKDLDPTNPHGSQSYYATIIRIHDRRIIRLEQEDDQIMSQIVMSSEFKDDFVLILNCRGDKGNEWNWNRTAQSSIYLVSTKDGSRKLIAEKLAENIANSYRLSPAGNYVIYYDPKQKNYFSYTISSGTIRNITKSINTIWTSYTRNDEPVAPYLPFWGPGFTEGDTGVLIYDQHDIYQIDPAGNLPPVNLTNGYGRKHNIVFTLALDYNDKVIPRNEKLILNAFNLSNKDNGFYSIELNKKEAPKLLCMEPVMYKGSDEINSEAPLKAKDGNTYLVKRMSASESPNYFFTTDFKIFAPVSNIHPENEYNWLTTELHTWKSLDGSTLQGILYKPENFDPRKKYPVIIHYYERLSDGLHAFIAPEASTGPINIPFFVSNGYLVFTPDIHYTIGKPGKSAFNSIVSAAKYLSNIHYVDKTKMGIQGHSFGGFETNYIVTHTNLFAAACSAAGMSNFISIYGSVIGDGSSRQRQYELYRDRMGTTPWQRKDLYVENSPVLWADKVATPLLIMHNKNDSDVPFAQSVELFTALRRLGKKVWMLQYDGEDHAIYNSTAAQNDYTIRITQFFDHYLKGAPAPKWMMHGIPAKMKGDDKGLELEQDAKTPGAGLLIVPSGKKLTKNEDVRK